MLIKKDVTLVGDKRSFSEELSHYLRARFSFLSISTWEEDRVVNDIKRICSDEELIKTKRTVYTWSVTDGLISESNNDFRKYKQPMQALEQIEKVSEPSVFILKDFHIYLGANGGQVDHLVVRKIRDLVSVIENEPHPKNVIFVSPSFSFPMELEKDIMIVDYGLPSYDEIKKVLYEMI